MLGIELTATSDTPMYQQLFDQIAERIRSGAWPPGYRLPATRALARDLRAHRNTVVRAYEELVATGYVESVVGRGTFVSDRAPAAPAPLGIAAAQRQLPWDALTATACDVEPLLRFDRFRRDAMPPHAINLTRMQPSDALLPHAALRRCIDHVLRSMGPRALGYAPREGVPRLREQIAAHLSRVGVPARAEDVLITTGSQQALDVVARALVNPGDRFLVDGTTYAGALNLLSVAGAQVVGVASDDHGPDMSALGFAGRGDAKGFYLMPNCHNPTGRTISAQRRRELVAWSHEAGVPLIEDDYGADLELDDAPAPPYLRGLDAEVTYVSTFSKKLIPALRVGFMIPPPAMRERFTALKHAMDLGTSALLQHALAEFLERGYLRAHYRHTLPEYRVRRDALHEALVSHMPPEVRWQLPSRGVVMWLSLPPELDPAEVYDAARRAGVIVTPGTLHAAHGRGEGGVRLTYCHEPAERLVEGAKRLGRAIATLMQTRRSVTAAPAVFGV